MKIAIAFLVVITCACGGGPLRGVVPVASLQHNCAKEGISYEVAGPNQLLVSGCGQQWLYTRRCKKCPWEDETRSVRPSCESDSDCRGDLVCVKGRCVSQ